MMNFDVVARQVRAIEGVEVESAHDACPALDRQRAGAVLRAAFVRHMLANDATTFSVGLKLPVEAPVGPLLGRNCAGSIGLGLVRGEHEPARDTVVELMRYQADRPV